ncbi:MAG: hypothetical protein US11_C0002G0026 [Candidatus Roizmanbacteria bacterium GW2011_GWA2_36_23]|uniref:Membrane protein 6-pyruvoyl-tetrahydropterin synthase-related domain-containing protein n=1 Tax=Candidatus Roizmanbacteria bacterium GW2011_GWA2_36_23 TaxID=1618480 RepID=A0A0G0E8X1_9BACT|nr:MAG: hypothetical protein US11_C0002G0026 [Candidatus Roizmanbacteria bacterium GW2011_GWA2_36_23]
MKKNFGSILFELLILLIITVPAFLVLLNPHYPSMHDDQHVARLFLLDQGIKQGNLFPRWVDGLGFGFGYPLYNFYPPFIYYLAEFFHIIGFSFLWSIKLVIISGFVLSAIGIYYLLKPVISKLAAFLGAGLYTYTFYHSINAYVRGALAEFFAMAITPLLFLSLYRLYIKKNLTSGIFFGLSFAVLILTHPLIALPSIFFIIFLLIAYSALSGKKMVSFIKYALIGLLFGLGLSSFFWLPSMVERKYTLTDEILTKELANYKDHFIKPSQLWYSPWGYGGSIKGAGDGMTFQLGKIPIALYLFSIANFILYLFRKKKFDFISIQYIVYCMLLFFSIWMSTSYSSIIWDNIRYLWYLQFPWRFLTFISLLVSICSAFGIYFFRELIIDQVKKININERLLFSIFVYVIIGIIVIKYQPYFKPQQLLKTTDGQRTSFEEIAWRISSTSYEFVPKGVKTKLTDLGTTIMAIEKKDIPVKPFEIISGVVDIQTVKNLFTEKQFHITAMTPAVLQLNNYYFPGWKAFVSGKEIPINHKNNFKLSRISLPQENNLRVTFIFTDTPVRVLGNWLSIISFMSVVIFCLKTIFRKSHKPEM